VAGKLVCKLELAKPNDELPTERWGFVLGTAGPTNMYIGSIMVQFALFRSNQCLAPETTRDDYTGSGER
jgi:hypothetical protein